MLFVNEVLAGVVCIVWLSNGSLHSQTRAVGIDLPASFSGSAPVSISRKEGTPIVRIRLVEEVREGSAASVTLATGSSEATTIEIKRSALSEQLLAAAFSAHSSLAARRAKLPTANIVVYIPEVLGPRSLSRSDQLKFARLVTELENQPAGTFIEVSGD